MTIVVLQDFIQYFSPSVTQYILIDSRQIVDITLDDNIIQFTYFLFLSFDVSTM